MILQTNVNDAGTYGDDTLQTNLHRPGQLEQLNMAALILSNSV